MKKNKQVFRPFDADDKREPFDEQFNVASATECTGLIPTPPMAEPEVTSYSEIYDIPLADGEKPPHSRPDKVKKNPEKHPVL